MGKRNRGPVPCTLCDRSFATVPHLQQHVRDGHPNVPTKASTTPVQPPVQEPQPVQPPVKEPRPVQHPVQEPQVQVKNEPVHAPFIPSLDTIICEHCLAPFPSTTALNRHKIAAHSWRCMKCPSLPPFESGTAWQTHFNAVHAGRTQPNTVTDTREKVAAPTKEVKPSKFPRGNSERSESERPLSGDINGQHRGASHEINIGVQSVETQSKSPSSGLASVTLPLIDSPPPDVVASGVPQDEVVSSASGDKPGFLTPKPVHQTTSNSEDQTVRVDDRDLLSSKGPTPNVLVEIEPEPHRDEIAYEIASDTLSPTMTASSIDTDDSEGEYGIPPSHSVEPLNGSSLEKEKHDITPPRGPKLGDRKSRTMSDAIVAGNHLWHDPTVQARDEPSGLTPSIVEEQYGAVGSDSPLSTTSSLQDSGWNQNRGDLPHDPLRTRRSKTGSVKPTPEMHFGCRICLSDPTPTSYLTATHCGHLFCYECIAAEVLRTSRCPVCKNVLALYCLFKLDMVS